LRQFGADEAIQGYVGFRLSRKAKQGFQDPGNRAYLNSLSAWEAALKHTLRRLKLSEPPAEFVPARCRYA